MEQYFSGLAKDKQDKIKYAEILVYECEGTENEIKNWFQTIKIAGSPLRPQELLNAVYSGLFVTKGKAEFSNSPTSPLRSPGAFQSTTGYLSRYLRNLTPVN